MASALDDLPDDIATLKAMLLAERAQSERLRPQGSEVERLLADSQRARQILGWTPRVSLEEGLDKTIDWLHAHQNNYRAGVYVI